jgi:serine/threonine protein kinase
MAAIHPGVRLGRYEVHEYVGAGTLGPVHLAHDATFGTVWIQALQQLSEKARPAFRELVPRLLALRHPNLASVLDSGDHEGMLYLVTEPGPTGALTQRLWSGPAEWDDAMTILEGVAAGLDHAHRGGVVHGSLRPDAILLGPDVRPLLADVGLESLRRPPGALSPDLTGERAAYLAPEQAAAAVATAASDRYALATLAYHLLTGRTPFAGDPDDVLRDHLHGTPRPPSQVNPRLGPAVDRVFSRGLAREPDVRWQTGAQLVAALREALGGLEAPDRVARPRTAPRWLPWAAVALAALVVGLAGFLIWRATATEGPPSPSPSASASATPTPTATPTATPRATPTP